MPATRMRPSSPEGIDAAQRWMTSRVGPVLVIALGCVILLAAAGRAAEFVAAELEGTTNNVSVEQGGATTFTITVKATGTIRCNATPTNPATAQLPTSFDIAANGAITPSSLSGPLRFFGTGSGTCNVSWSSDPTPYRLSATVRADLYAPVGNRTIRLSPVLFTPGGSGAALRDDTATLITFSVTPGTDREPPEVNCDGPKGTQGSNGWYVEPVSYDCVALDRGSGLADPADATFTLETDGEGSVSVPSRTVSDVVGNSIEAGPFGPYDVDLHDPIVEVSEPAQNESYIVHSSATAQYDCDDTPGGSGVAKCAGNGIDTSSVGEKKFVVESLDKAGRRTKVERTYHVVYDVTPMDSSGPERDQEAGSAIVIRWKVDGQSSPRVVTSMASAPAECGATDVAPGGTPVDGSPVRYNPGTKDYSFTWRTERAWTGTCRQLQMTLNDGMTRTMSVSFK